MRAASRLGHRAHALELRSGTGDPGDRVRGARRCERIADLICMPLARTSRDGAGSAPQRQPYAGRTHLS